MTDRETGEAIARMLGRKPTVSLADTEPDRPVGGIEGGEEPTGADAVRGPFASPNASWKRALAASLHPEASE